MNDQIVIERPVKQKGEEILNLQSLIESHVRSIRELTHELKSTREMYQDSFVNNPVYKENDDKVKAATRARNSVRENIAKQPSVAILDQKIQDLKFDINESKKTLSDLLIDYKEQSGATQLELFESETVTIVETAKLVKTR